MFNHLPQRSKRNIEVLGEVNFSVDGWLKITEIHHINRIEPVDLKEEISMN